MSIGLIDVTKEEACRTAEANAIRAKTGGSTQIAYDFANDKGFADAIAAIPAGGGGSGQSGTYTPTEKTDTVVISVTGNPTHFVFAADEAYAGGNGSSFHMAYAIKNGITVGLRTNSAGTAYSPLTSATTVTFGNGTITLYSPLNIGIQPIPFSWAAW